MHDSTGVLGPRRQPAAQTRIIGPNCPGIDQPRQVQRRHHPGRHHPGRAGSAWSASRHADLPDDVRAARHRLLHRVGIGGDPVIGTTHIDCLQAFQDDPETDAIVMIGEIGGDAEERAAAYIAENVTKPVVGYVAGFTAPEGKTMGHAGAIVSGSSGTAAGQEGGARGRRRPGRQDAAARPPGSCARSCGRCSPSSPPDLPDGPVGARHESVSATATAAPPRRAPSAPVPAAADRRRARRRSRAACTGGRAAACSSPQTVVLLAWASDGRSSVDTAARPPRPARLAWLLAPRRRRSRSPTARVGRTARPHRVSRCCWPAPGLHVDAGRRPVGAGAPALAVGPSVGLPYALVAALVAGPAAWATCAPAPVATLLATLLVGSLTRRVPARPGS